MSRKFFGILAAATIVLTGCNDTHSATDKVTDKPAASETKKEEPKPTLSETTLKRALKETDLKETPQEDRNVYDAPVLHLEVPKELIRQHDKKDGRIGFWKDADESRSIVLAVVGTAGVAQNAENYAAMLREAPQAQGKNVDVQEDVEFGDVSAHHISVSGGAYHSEIFAFTVDGVAYELTLNAKSPELLDTLRPFALTTVATPKEHRSAN
ncbi:hypothetical protein [Arcanobacterium haemolyticum]